MKKILITGASRGLGKYLRQILLSNRYFVYGTTRNLDKATEKDNLQFFYLDFTNNDSIDRLTDYFIKSDVRLDAIIHNSGIAYLDPIDVLSEKECREIFDINFFGPVKLTNKLLPLLRKQNEGKLIFISSIVSIDHWPYLGAYAASKAAIEAVAFEWAVLLRKWNIHVSVIQPNPLPTDMEIRRSINAPNSLYPELHSRNLKWENIDDVGQLILKILEMPNPKFMYQTGPFSEKTANTFHRKNAYEKSIKRHLSLFK